MIGNVVFPKEEIGRRLEQALVGHSLRQVGDAAGVSHTAVRQWYQGKYLPESERLIAVCEEFGLSLDELVGLPARSTPVPVDADYHPVPMYRSRVCAGPGAVMTDEVAEWHQMRIEWIKRNVDADEELVRMHVASSHIGESMVPTIFPGAVLTIALHPNPKIREGKIYLVRDEDGGMTIKRIYHGSKKGELLCVSDNHFHPPFTIRPDRDEGRVRGRVLRWEQGEI